MESNLTCAERISSQLQNRNIYLEELYDKIDGDDRDEASEASDELQTFALEVSEYKVIKVLLSTGGPADWVEVKLDENHNIESMEYFFQDWFDIASKHISEDSYLWQYVSDIVETY